MSRPNVKGIESFSRSSVYLRLFFQEQPLALATGLLAKAINRQVFLISALHNMTGREPDGRCKSATAALPNFVEITGWHFQARLPLYQNNNDPNADAPFFRRHRLGANIDVCALSLKNPALDTLALDSSFLDPVYHGATVKLSIAQLCFVVGYPEGLFVRESERAVLPVWKTGHIASEPSVYVDSVPKLLIDAATCDGMSGSPVYVRERENSRLLGIYTGRTSQLSELGFVFTPEVILEIISGNGVA